MSYIAKTRLTLTKSKADPKPVVEKDEPFPAMSEYSEEDLAWLERDGLIEKAAEKPASERKASRAKSA